MYKKSKNTPPVADKKVEKFFYDKPYIGSGGPIRLRELPFLARKINEHIHQVKPEVVVAGDRGGRLIALASMIGWHKRYPGERFPTIGGKIHYARVTSRSAGEEEVNRAVLFTLKRSGLEESQSESAQQDGSSPRVVYLDDWAVNGYTARRFVKAAHEFGIAKHALSYATMVGRRVDLPKGAEHYIADPSRDPSWSTWDTHNSELYGTDYGVRYLQEEPTVPIADVNPNAIQTRQSLIELTQGYYAKFTDAHSHFLGSVSLTGGVTN